MHWLFEPSLGSSGLCELLGLRGALLRFGCSGGVRILLADSDGCRFWSFHHCLSWIKGGPDSWDDAVHGLRAYQCLATKSEAGLVDLLLLLGSDGPAVALAVVPGADWIFPWHLVSDTHRLASYDVRIWSVCCVSDMGRQWLGRDRHVPKGRLHAPTRLQRLFRPHFNLSVQRFSQPPWRKLNRALQIRPRLHVAQLC